MKIMKEEIVEETEDEINDNNNVNNQSENNNENEIPEEQENENTNQQPQEKQFQPLQKQSFLLKDKIDELIFCGESMERIILLTENSGKAYHTKNFGKNWSLISNTFDSYHSLMNMEIITLLQNPNNLNQIIFVDKKLENMITNDCGETYKPLFDRQQLKDVLFHPTQKDIILGIAEENDLMLSKDSGNTWTKIQSQVKEFMFAKFSDNAYFANQNRIFAIIEELSPKNKILKNLYFSDDFFTKKALILQNVEFFKITKCCVYAKQKNGEMQVSDAFGWFYHFNKLEIENLENETFNEFNIIDNDFLYSPYAVMSFNYKNTELNKLMKSDYYGGKFQILKEDLVCEKMNSFCDFIPIKSLDGVILINVYDKSYIEASLSLPKSRRNNYSSVKSFKNLEDFKQTFISFDYGEKFHRIQSPQMNHKNFTIKCDDCFLNLHLYSSMKNYQLPKSHETFPGFIIASGSVSKYLADEDDIEEYHQGVFISQDGGLNWKMIAQGKYFYEVLNQGSVIILAQKGKPTDEIRYSLNNGNDFKKLSISNNKVEIFGITVQNQLHLKKLVISAKSTKGFSKKYQIITLDFSNLYERDCEHDKSNIQESDYEEWIPHTADEGGCLNGRQVVYVRKKMDRECFNPDKYSLFFIKDHCQCTDDDYHCDFGYSKNDIGNCILDPEVNVYNFLQDPLHCNDFFWRTDGYKKNYESFCQNGVTHTERKVYCNSKGWFSFIHIRPHLPSIHFGLPHINIFGSGLFGKLFRLLLLGGFIYACYFIYINQYYYDILDRVDQIWQKIKGFKERKRIESNVYSELQQKEFTLQNQSKENIGSIFETNDEEEVGVISRNKVFDSNEDFVQLF